MPEGHKQNLVLRRCCACFTLLWKWRCCCLRDDCGGVGPCSDAGLKRCCCLTRGSVGGILERRQPISKIQIQTCGPHGLDQAGRRRHRRCSCPQRSWPRCSLESVAIYFKLLAGTRAVLSPTKVILIVVALPRNRTSMEAPSNQRHFCIGKGTFLFGLASLAL